MRHVHLILLFSLLILGCGKETGSTTAAPAQQDSPQAAEVSSPTQQAAPEAPKVTDTVPEKPEQLIDGAIYEANIDALKALFAEYPEMIHHADPIGGNWVCEAVDRGHVNVVNFLLDMGLDINHCIMPGSSTPLTLSMIQYPDDPRDNYAFAKQLLSRGADPNIGRPVIRAINYKDPELGLRMIKLLVEHGADVNQVFDLYGDKDNQFTALDWSSGEIKEYLLSQGAKSAKELKEPAADAKPKPDRPKTLSEQVVDFFSREVGPVQPKSLLEIVPDETPITIHVVPATEDRKQITLFTTGLSVRAMNVPQDWPEHDKFELAELFIDLPADWKFTELADPNWSWPIFQLRWLGKFPHENDTWLGAPITVVAHGDPPEPLAPNTTFDSLLLVPEKHFVSEEGRTIQLYRVLPLYPAERKLEARKGFAALMRALDKKKVPFVVDLDRPNAAK